jgi:dTMP kinase
VSGLFITFEGGDGSGKTTQVSLLASWLESQGHNVVVTREPGGTDVGVELRNIVLHRKGALAPRAEALLYAADRAHHIYSVVRPALEAGKTVVQDRYLDSSVAYQGAGRVLEEQEVRDLSLWATEGLLPDLTIVLDAPGDYLRARISGDGRVFDRLEAEGDEFHERVRQAYHRFAEAWPDRIHLLDATTSVDSIHQQVRQLVSEKTG